MTTSIIREISNKKFYLLGIILILAGWQVLAWFSHPLIVASPASTVRALYGMLANGELAKSLLITLQRQLLGLILGVIAGTSLGVIGGMKVSLDNMFLPAINTILATPGVIFVVIAMVWFGQGSTQVVFVTALLVLPIMYVNAVKGIHSIESNLLQMVKIYRVPWEITIRKLYLPGLLNGFIAGFSLSVASSFRTTIMAELLGAQNGIGNAIFVTRGYLETDKLFAWTVTLIVMVTLVEFLVFNPLNKHIRKWQAS